MTHISSTVLMSPVMWFARQLYIHTTLACTVSDIAHQSDHRQCFCKGALPSKIPFTALLQISQTISQDVVRQLPIIQREYCAALMGDRGG